MMKGCSTDKKIFIISLCKEKLNENEFVLPLYFIVKEALIRINKNREYKIKITHYKDFFHNNYKNFINASLLIFSGTALKDFDYLNYVTHFVKFKKNLKNSKVIGICAGAQLLAYYYKLPLKELEKPLIDVVLEKGKKYYFLTSYLPLKTNFFINKVENYNLKNLQKSFKTLRFDNKEYIIYFNINNNTAFFYHPEVLNKEELIEEIINILSV